MRRQMLTGPAEEDNMAENLLYLDRTSGRLHQWTTVF